MPLLDWTGNQGRSLILTCLEKLGSVPNFPNFLLFHLSSPARILSLKEQ